MYECVVLYLRDSPEGPEISVWRDYYPGGRRRRHSVAVYRLGKKGVPWAPSDILRAVADQMEANAAHHTV